MAVRGTPVDSRTTSEVVILNSCCGVRSFEASMWLRRAVTADLANSKRDICTVVRGGMVTSAM